VNEDGSQDINQVDFSQTIKEIGNTKTTITTLSVTTNHVDAWGNVTYGVTNTWETTVTETKGGDGKWERTNTIESFSNGLMQTDVLDKWTREIADFQKINEQSYNKWTVDRGMELLGIAEKGATLPFLASGYTGSISLESIVGTKMWRIIEVLGLPFSVDRGGELIRSKVVEMINYRLVHSYAASYNGMVHSLPRTPQSKDDAYIGPASFQDLLDPEKWLELWTGKER
jgi:hypothetical protein